MNKPGGAPGRGAGPACPLQAGGPMTYSQPNQCRGVPPDAVPAIDGHHMTLQRCVAAVPSGPGL